MTEQFSPAAFTTPRIRLVVDFHTKAHPDQPCALTVELDPPRFGDVDVPVLVEQLAAVAYRTDRDAERTSSYLKLEP